MEKLNVRTLIISTVRILACLVAGIILLLSGVSYLDPNKGERIFRLFIDSENSYLASFGFISLILSIAVSILLIATYKKYEMYKLNIIVLGVSIGFDIITSVLYSFLFMSTKTKSFTLNVFAILFLIYLFIDVLLNSFMIYHKYNEYDKHLESMYINEENSVFKPFNID